MSNATDPAFPSGVMGELPNGVYEYPLYGLTKRELFALKALQGLMSNPQGPIQANGMNGWGLVNCTWQQVAGAAVRAGDALLAELDK